VKDAAKSESRERGGCTCGERLPGNLSFTNQFGVGSVALPHTEFDRALRISTRINKTTQNNKKKTTQNNKNKTTQNDKTKTTQNNKL
jgi:hypothetical protein